MYATAYTLAKIDIGHSGGAYLGTYTVLPGMHCAGAPVYQMANADNTLDPYVLYMKIARQEIPWTQWYVGITTHLDSCEDEWSSPVLDTLEAESGRNYGLSGPPTVPAYNFQDRGWRQRSVGEYSNIVAVVGSHTLTSHQTIALDDGGDDGGGDEQCCSTLGASHCTGYAEGVVCNFCGNCGCGAGSISCGCPNGQWLWDEAEHRCDLSPGWDADCDRTC
jgi:hypothetical protein